METYNIKDSMHNALTDDAFDALTDFPSGRQEVVLFCLDMVTIQITCSTFDMTLLSSNSITSKKTRYLINFEESTCH